MLTVMRQKLPLRVPKRSDIERQWDTPDCKNTRCAFWGYKKIPDIAETDISVIE